MTRRRSSGALEGIALLVSTIGWAFRFTIRHPRAVLLGVGGYLIFISVALSNESFVDGLIALLVYLVAIAIWQHHRRQQRSDATAGIEAQHVRRPGTLRDLLMLSPMEFEAAVADQLRRDGYRNVRRVGGAGDLAVDIFATAPDGYAVAVQCKRYSPHVPVRSPELQM